MGSRFLIILGIVLLAEYYGYVLIRSITKTLSPGWKIGITVAYILLTALCWSGFIFFRDLQKTNIPHAVKNLYIAFGMGMLTAKILILLVMLIDDIRRASLWALNGVTSKKVGISETGSNTIARSTFLKNTAVFIGGITLLGFAYGINNRYNYRVRKIKLKFPNLPEAFKGLKVVQISDIHTGSFDNHTAVAHGIERILDQNADIILFTGDLVNNVSDEVDEKYQEIFSRLRAPLGVYSTLGNHDYGDYVSWPSEAAKKENLERLKQIHAKQGWRLLMNEHIILERNNQKIALIGIENWGNKAHFPKYGKMDVAYAGIEEQQIPFKILLSHDPSHWDAEVRTKYKNIDLTLSGHTHGMQFGIDSAIFKWSPIQYMYKQWAGLYQEDNQYLYVNRGFGFLGYPGRLGILPEITVFELS